jgi:signal transduction histidine kinase
MSPPTIAPSSLSRTIRYVEWTLLALHFLLTAILLFLNRDITYPTTLPAWMVYGSLTTCAILSLVFPSDRPLWQRRLYIFLEIAAILPAQLMGWGLDLFLYLFLAKSCFLLSRRDLIITVILTGIAWHSIQLFDSLHNWAVQADFIRSNLDTLFQPQRFIWSSLINNVGVYLAASTFVVLISLLIVAEQKSRRKAESLMQEVETLAAQLERTRIARDIHDSLGHTLINLDVQIELAERLYQQNSDQTLQVLGVAKKLANQCVQETRLAVQTLRQNNFDLNEAIATLVDQVQQNQPFIIHFHIDFPSLPLQVSHQIYCIVQEGLTNIQKHASPLSVKLGGWTTVDTIIIELVDDGCGFDPFIPSTGFGLRGMQERVQLLGGELKVESAEGKGTCIQVVIPREAIAPDSN